MSNKPQSVLALHGFTGCGEDFARFSPLCHSVGAWNCPDLPGHGRNTQSDCSPEATRQWIQDTLDELSDLKPNILLGYSAGARAALLHATKHPESWDALVLISPNPGIRPQETRSERVKADTALAARLVEDGVEAFMEYWQSTPMIRTQKNTNLVWRDEMRANRKLHTAKGLATSLLEFGQGNYPDLWNQLQNLTMPTLLITGETDSKYTDIAKESLPLIQSASAGNAHHAIIAKAGHAPHFEAPQETADAINAFLERVF